MKLSILLGFLLISFATSEKCIAKVKEGLPCKPKSIGLHPKRDRAGK